MKDLFLTNKGNFINYSNEHLACFVGTLVFIGYILYKAKNHWTPLQQRKYIFLLCTAGAITQLFKIVYKYYAGIFDWTTDVPLHLCNILTLILPFIMWYRWRIGWSITFFWIMAGCAQSIFTPTVSESLPHYEAIRYWLVHAVIILAGLYGWYIYKFSLTWKDALLSGIWLNLIALIIYPINNYLGSNYMYLNAKPSGETFYSLLGPWPEYIVALEVILVILFGILLIPFYIRSFRYIIK
ncbi:MAG: TIGR02206 family membrane protein [Saprospiraceae bacterium]